MTRRHEFIKCKKCTKTKRRTRAVQPGFICTPCMQGGKRTRRKRVKK